MRTAGGLVIVVALAVLAAAPAAAQSVAAPADPIDALLRHPPAHRTIDPDEPDTAAEGTTRVAPDPVAANPPDYRPPPRPALSAPVYIGETGKAPDGPPAPADLAYDNRLRASAAAAAGFQGPMEGGWTLSGGGRELYVFQLVDKDGVVEGAWRDPRRAASLGGSGFIDAVERNGADMTFRFAGQAVAVLHDAGGGRWSGELSDAGKTETVSLARRNP